MSIAFRFITKSLAGDLTASIPPYQVNGKDIVVQQIFLSNVMVFQGEGINNNPDTFWNKYNLKIDVKPNYTKHLFVEERQVSKIDNVYTYDLVATRIENFDVIISAKQQENNNDFNVVWQYADLIYEYLTFYSNPRKARDILKIMYMQTAGNMIDLSYTEDVTGVIKKAQGFSIKYQYTVASNLSYETLQSVVIEYKTIANNDITSEGSFVVKEFLVEE